MSAPARLALSTLILLDVSLGLGTIVRLMHSWWREQCLRRPKLRKDGPVGGCEHSGLL